MTPCLEPQLGPAAPSPTAPGPWALGGAGAQPQGGPPMAHLHPALCPPGPRTRAHQQPTAGFSEGTNGPGRWQCPVKATTASGSRQVGGAGDRQAGTEGQRPQEDSRGSEQVQSCAGGGGRDQSPGARHPGRNQRQGLRVAPPPQPQDAGQVPPARGWGLRVGPDSPALRAESQPPLATPTPDTAQPAVLAPRHTGPRNRSRIPEGGTTEGFPWERAPRRCGTATGVDADFTVHDRDTERGLPFLAPPPLHYARAEARESQCPQLRLLCPPSAPCRARVRLGSVPCRKPLSSLEAGGRPGRGHARSLDPEREPNRARPQPRRWTDGPAAPGHPRPPSH